MLILLVLRRGGSGGLHFSLPSAVGVITLLGVVASCSGVSANQLPSGSEGDGEVGTVDADGDGEREAGEDETVIASVDLKDNPDVRRMGNSGGCLAASCCTTLLSACDAGESTSLSGVDGDDFTGNGCVDDRGGSGGGMGRRCGSGATVDGNVPPPDSPTPVTP